MEENDQRLNWLEQKMESLDEMEEEENYRQGAGRQEESVKGACCLHTVGGHLLVMANSRAEVQQRERSLGRRFRH